MSRLSHNVYFASLSIHTQSIHARVYVDIYRVVRKVISSPRTSYSSQLRSKLFLSSELQLIYIQEKFVLLSKKSTTVETGAAFLEDRLITRERIPISPIRVIAQNDSMFRCMKKGNYFPNDKRDVRRIFARVPGRSTYRENWTDQGMAGPHGAFYGRDPSTANNVCYTRRRTSRNVRIISLRIITHYIPRYAVCIVYYAAKKKLWDFCGPVMGLTRGTITMQPARIFVYPRNTWRGISNCIVNNLGKLRV